MASTHTLGSFHINRWTHLFLTTYEMVNPSIALKNDGGLTFLNPSSTMAPNPYSGLFSSKKGYKHDVSANIKWGHYSDGSPADDYIIDDRRLGNYLKVWGSEHHKTILGEGHHNLNGGPIGSYETHEIIPGNFKINGRNAALTNSQIAPLYNILDAADGNIQPGIGGSHHFNSVYGVTGQYYDDSAMDYKINRELYVANYTAGVRVLDFKEYLKPEITDFMSYHNSHDFDVKTIHERAYFDYVPTLTYNIHDRYFYALHNDIGRKNESTDTEDYFRDQLFRGPNYYNGIMDALPDLPQYRVEIENDENFVYAMGRNGKQSPWSQNGGFLILRYFRDELGGTISGFTGGVNSPAFREVNLQGDFALTRHLIIDTHAVVTLLPGKESENGIFQSTSVTPVGQYGNRYIHVYGTLKVGIPDGDNDGTMISIKSDYIFVHPGGKLIIYKIRDNQSEPVVFDSRIYVDGNGLLEIRQGAYVAFNKKVTIRGKIATFGTNTEPITIVGSLKPNQKIADFSNLYDYPVKIVVDGYNKKSIIEHFYNLNYTRFMNCNIDLINAYAYGYEIRNCHFIDSIESLSSTDLEKGLSLVFCYMRNENILGLGKKGRVTFKNCSFSDNTGFTTATHGKFVEHHLRRSGLLAMNMNYIGFTNCEFNQLENAIRLENVNDADISENSFDNCKIGCFIISSLTRLCTNEFNDCMVAAAFTSLSMKSNIFDNEINTTQTGIKLVYSGDQWLKGNVFNYYTMGVSISGCSKAWLAPYPSHVSCLLNPPGGDKWYNLGRNHFEYPSTPSSVDKFTMLNYSYDIALDGDCANVILKCGKNNFAEYSERHLSNNGPYKYIDVSTNKFNPLPYDVRYNSSNLGIYGSPRDKSENPFLACPELLWCLQNCDFMPSEGGGVGGDDGEPFEDVMIRRPLNIQELTLQQIGHIMMSQFKIC